MKKPFLIAAIVSAFSLLASASASATSTIIPTPIMPYYPNISPWIFIIPGIIVFLFIIFQ